MAVEHAHERMPRYTRGTVIRKGLIGAGSLSAGLTLAHRWPGIALGARNQSMEGHAVQEAAGLTNGAATPTMAAANLDFAFRLHNTLARTNGQANLFHSPLSISIALDMAYNGASGATQKAMATALSRKDVSVAGVNRANQSLIKALQGRDAQVALNIADSIWLRKGLTVAPQFGAALRTYYGAGVESLNFDDPSAPSAINAWVKARTHGLIPAIVKSIDPATVMYLINALYFKAPWSMPFEKRATRPSLFTTADGVRKHVPMMSTTADFAYMRTASYQAIRLPYASGKISMYIVLPAANASLTAMMPGLTPASWTALVSSLRTTYGSIGMPRFSVDFNQALKPALTALGMGLAFDPEHATFPNMIQGRRAYITDVKHRAIMKVDEAGTLAAAVTSVGIGVTAVRQSGFSMVVDRPFFCAIQDDVSGTLLFMGAVNNPGAP